MATPNPSAATSVGTGATAAAGVPAAAASAAAALAGLHDAAPPSEAGTGPSGRLGGQHHVVTGLTSQKQVSLSSCKPFVLLARVTCVH